MNENLSMRQEYLGMEYWLKKKGDEWYFTLKIINSKRDSAVTFPSAHEASRSAMRTIEVLVESGVCGKRNTNSELREVFAVQAHKSWSGWMKYLFSHAKTDMFGNIIIPKYFVSRWKRQMATDYSNLPEKEKESDREEADEYIKLIEETT
jgi:hypothetical protein